MISDLWYKNAVIYSLSVATYMDANGDGVGDFARVPVAYGSAAARTGDKSAANLAAAAGARGCRHCAGRLHGCW